MHSSNKQFDIIVIGGGAAGMMAAGTAAARGKRVLVLEKNKRLGEKLRITGGGRCNITNYELDTRKLLKNYGKAEPFLHSLFAQFGVPETEAFFNKLGIRFKVEANKRAFPHTESAPDVAEALVAWCIKNKVVIHTGETVTSIRTGDGVIEAVITSRGEYTAHHYILATGGLSHPETGSTGDGMKWLQELGHATAEPTPTLVPIAIKDAWPKTISGVTLPDVKITVRVDGAKKFSKTGNILCTHFGFSGPLILNSAKQVADALHEGQVTGTIDLFPKMDMGNVDQALVTFLQDHKNKVFKNCIKAFLPDGTLPAVAAVTDKLGSYDGVILTDIWDTKVHSISKEARRAFVRLLKEIPFTVKGLMGYDKAIVADGGILLSEIDMRTLRSKKFSNVLVTGDLLNINRPSGGYSLQLCWTTGYVAGNVSD